MVNYKAIQDINNAEREVNIMLHINAYTCVMIIKALTKSAGPAARSGNRTGGIERSHEICWHFKNEDGNSDISVVMSPGINNHRVNSLT